MIELKLSRASMKLAISTQYLRLVFCQNSFKLSNTEVETPKKERINKIDTGGNHESYTL
jgi:hypothetical protein